MGVVSMCIYRVRPEVGSEFEDLLERHWATLRKLNLASDTPPQTYRGKDDTGRPIYVELLEWKDADGPDMAHELPEVMAVWESMGKLCEERPNRMSMEFPHVEEIRVHEATDG